MTKNKVQDISVNKVKESVENLEDKDITNHFDEDKEVKFNIKPKLKIKKTKKKIDELIKE